MTTYFEAVSRQGMGEIRPIPRMYMALSVMHDENGNKEEAERNLELAIKAEELGGYKPVEG